MFSLPLLKGLRLSVIGMASVVLCLSLPAQADKGPLIGGADVGNAPYIIQKPDGTYTGFDVEMLAEIAKRMGRPGYKLVDQQWSGIFAGLDAQRFELIMASTVITEKRAEAMLFTEATHDNDYRFLSRASDPDIKSLDDLRGKRIAVNQGNVYDQWLTDRADEYKWEVARYAKNSDAVQAVLANRADANLASAGATTWTAVKNPMLKGGLVVNSGQTKGLAFRLDDAELRNEVENVIECMKLDGTIAKLQEKWLGVEAGPDSITRNVQVGYGESGMPGYDPTPHTPKCD